MTFYKMQTASRLWLLLMLMVKYWPASVTVLWNMAKKLWSRENRDLLIIVAWMCTHHHLMWRALIDMFVWRWATSQWPLMYSVIFDRHLAVVNVNIVASYFLCSLTLTNISTTMLVCFMLYFHYVYIYIYISLLPSVLCCCWLGDRKLCNLRKCTKSDLYIFC